MAASKHGATGWAANVFGLVDGQLWQDCHTVGMVESVRDTGKKEAQVEQRYFISSAALEVGRFLTAAAPIYWHIENRLHWSLDVTFGENYVRTCKDHVPQNVTLLSKIALNLLRLDTAHPKLSLSQRRKTVGWNDDVRMHMLGLQRIG